jgi:hypothetical protein
MAADILLRDRHALGRALQAFRKISPWHANEVREMLRSDGWTETAKHCAQHLQRTEQNLTTSEVPPCELHEETIGGITQIWMADPEGIDLKRAEIAMLLRKLLRLGLSRYEPSPERACRAAEERRRALTAPTGDVA